MAGLFGKNLSRQEILSRAGDLSQLAGAEEFRYTSGREENMRGIRVYNGGGLEFVVLPSRGMDIAGASYRGIPLSFISKAGLSAPAFYEKDGLGFLRNFTCGLVTTCGLTYMGAPCKDEEEELGLHGRISNIPARDCCISNEWKEDAYILRLTGKIRQSGMFQENLVMQREIRTGLGEHRLWIKDEIINEGFSRTPFMLLYHINFGYPLVDEHTVLELEHDGVRSRDARAEEGIRDCAKCSAPTAGFTEQLYYYDTSPDKDGYVKATLYNPDLNGGMRVYLRYLKEQLPYLAEWKQMGQGDYVFGLEPGTWLPEGREKARRLNQLIYLEPGQCYRTELEIGVEGGVTCQPVSER